jgi:hypothetical protein
LNGVEMRLTPGGCVGAGESDRKGEVSYLRADRCERESGRGGGQMEVRDGREQDAVIAMANRETERARQPR